MRDASPAGRLAFVEPRLLAAHDLDAVRVQQFLSELGGDFAELFFEAGRSESWRLQEEKVTSGGFTMIQGVGIRSISGDRTNFAYSGDISPKSIAMGVNAVQSMRTHASAKVQARGARLPGHETANALFTLDDPIQTLGAAEKIRLLQQIDQRARAIDPRIVKVTADVQTSHTYVLVAASDGAYAADVRPQMQLRITVIAEMGDKRASGAAGEGGRFHLTVIDDARIDQMVARAVRIALTNLDARPTPAGVMPIVLGPGFPGVLIHEAVGHGLEGDFHRKGTSVFANRMGGMIAAPGVTIIDDGAIGGRRGSLNIDDEGTPTQATTLIEDGRLVGLMQDGLNGHLMRQRTTGNARRQSYAHLPMPRMTNTFLAAGKYAPDEIIASVNHGIYATDFGGGSVDITSGQFNFSTTEAYLIENGRLTAPIQGSTLIGLGHEALKQITMVGDDLELDNGVCGKDGQNVPVCVGQPTVRIDDMVVGGSV